MSVIALTGASSGIGRNAAVALGVKGHSLGLIARNETALNEVKNRIEQAGGKAMVIVCDVAESGALDSAAERIERELGAIDVWINCAMALVFGKFEEIPFEEYRRVTDVAYHGYVMGTRAALRRMKTRNKGHIIQIGSALSYRALPMQSAYCGAKHAIRGFTNSLRAELIRERSAIHLTMIQFPAFNTPLYSWCKLHVDKEPHPQNPVHDPELAAEVVVWATEHPQQREVWAGGIVWLVILGQKMFPGLSDWVTAKIAWDGQLTDKAPAADRQNNLFTAVEGAERQKGRFTEDEITKRPWLWTVPNQNFWINSAGFLLLALAFLFGLFLG